MANKRNN